MRLADPTVDFGYLLHPPAAVGVLQFQNSLQRPVEVIGDVGYLLMEPLWGVAGYSPRLATVSTSKLWPHSGQLVAMSVLPFSLMRRYKVCR